MGQRILAGQLLTAALLNQYYGQSDTNATVMNTTGPVNLSTPYTIPANEAQQGSAYEVLFAGTGTWATGATLQNLAFSLFLQGSSVLANTNIDHSVFASGAAVRFSGRALLVCDTSGASGGFYCHLVVSMNQIANNIIPGTAANNTVTTTDFNATPTTTDTTSAASVIVKAGWAGTVGSPTITNRHTSFQKIA